MQAKAPRHELLTYHFDVHMLSECGEREGAIIIRRRGTLENCLRERGRRGSKDAAAGIIEHGRRRENR